MVIQIIQNEISVPPTLKIQNNGNAKSIRKDQVNKENVTDAIIKAFTVKRRKAMIDEEDNDDDNVDYETSERRLIILATILAFILIIFATIMTSLLAKQFSKTSFIILQLTMEKESQFPLVPYLALFPKFYQFFFGGFPN